MSKNKKRNTSPSSKELIFGKALIIIGLLSIVIFLAWFMKVEFKGEKWLYYILVSTFLYRILVRLYEWWFCWHISVPQKSDTNKLWKVDILTTFCKGEPKAMLYDTLKAISKISYPHETYLCDESNDPELKRYCTKNNVSHVTRVNKINAKAGNINNALYTVAKGEICVILDPDHIPTPDFLNEVLPYFEDEEVGFVQVPQVYYNQQSTIIAKAAAQQTYQFYGPFMMGLNTYGAVPAIGANCTFRREALDSIGGHAPGLTEDMHTAMLLHSKKWKSVYNPVIVAKGLVPWNYSGYCQQQLKWSRGSFDLLFNVLPRISKNLTWKQIAYYLSAPFFYFSGLMAVFDFLIPIITLLTGIIPIKISLLDFALFYSPFIIISFFIRQFNQRWLFEEHEKGAFIFGGTLFKATWWASLLGFFYALINKKVPYIPTPKDNSYESPVNLLVPNFVIITVSIFSIVYGLIKDFNPFIIFMAFLAFVNILILFLGNVMALQKLIIKIHNRYKGSFISKGSKTRLWVYSKKQRFFTFMQKASFSVTLAVLISFFSIRNGSFSCSNKDTSKHFNTKEKYVPNLVGYSKENNEQISNLLYDTITYGENIIDDIINFYNTCSKLNKLPYINLQLDDNQLDSIINNNYDSTFYLIFEKFNNDYLPVIMSLVQNQNYNDSLIALGIEHLSNITYKVGYPNIGWIWHIHDANYRKYTDSINYMISWFLIPEDMVKSIVEKFKIGINEKPIILFDGNKIFTYAPSSKRIDEYNFNIFSKNNFILNKKRENKKLKDIEYIKGVAYNPGHDWRDNKNTLPLTIKKLEHDFDDIKKMGANTIRRYNPSIYDKNILKVAKKKDIKIIYGFWFEKDIDYLKDLSKKEKYKKEVISFVKKNKGNKSIIAWSLGNETWGLMKHYYNEPYLSFVRKSYIDMISDISSKINEIDTLHPIITVEEHTYHLPSAIYAVNHYTQDIDIIGVNSYYNHNISSLDSIMEIYSDIKYLVTEFGPEGYWENEYNHYIFDTLLYEPNSFNKAEWISYQWKNYIYENKGKNIGGIAFCWQDRYESTSTWFGLEDIFGNKTPSWYALKNCYLNDTTDFSFPIPRFEIFLSKDYLSPGKKGKIKSGTLIYQKKDNFFYKWIVYEEKSFRKYLETPFKKGQSELEFKMPSKKSNYRITLYVSDNNGNVITESSPLLISWK